VVSNRLQRSRRLRRLSAAQLQLYSLVKLSACRIRGGFRKLAAHSGLRKSGSNGHKCDILCPKVSQTRPIVRPHEQGSIVLVPPHWQREPIFFTKAGAHASNPANMTLHTLQPIRPGPPVLGAVLQPIRRTTYSQPSSIQNVSVDHRGGDIAMSQKLLNRPDIVTILQEMSRK
jgi:hypothetical protein